jgi:hypothetical protein
MTSFQQWSSNASFDAMAASKRNRMSGGIPSPFSSYLTRPQAEKQCRRAQRRGAPPHG